MPVEDRVREPVIVDRSWWSGVGAHGGYVAALGLTEMRAALGDDRPVRSLSTQFLAPIDDRPLIFDTTVRRGSSSPRGAAVCTMVATQSTASDSSGPGAALLGTALFGTGRTGPDYADRVAPPVIPLADAMPISLPPKLLPLAVHLEFRLAGDRLALTGGERAELAAWIRFIDGRPVDATAAAVLTDAMPPGLFALWTAPRPVPSVDLAVHFTDALDNGPAGDWALVTMRTVQAGSGWAVDDSEVWSADGRLLALGRQSRRVRENGQPNNTGNVSTP